VRFAFCSGWDCRTAGQFTTLWFKVGILLLVGWLTVDLNVAAQPEVPPNNNPVTLQAGTDWIPLKLDLDIAVGSALDFSKMSWLDTPAGKHGWMIARPDGQFAFEKNPEIPRRFYGVNLCFSAQYLPHAEAGRLADRMARLGYNAIRIHHYEGILAEDQDTSTHFNPERLDQLDYLLWALIQRGIYITTDLYVSRPVTEKEIGINGNAAVGMDRFKQLVPVHAGAWENWRQFSWNFLDHVNPYTKRRYADEPALAWLSMINEGNFANFYADLRKIPEWKAAWNRWLAKAYPQRSALATAWGRDLQESEDPVRGSAELPAVLGGDSVRARDCITFLAATERNMLQKMTVFLREDLHCKALITNSNGWTNFTTSQDPRTLYDYVDDHFYIDHPTFLKQDWTLPSASPNTSPVARGAVGGRDRCFTRLFGKPFTITEYNYSAPGRYRGVGGILTGALGALQGWGGIWRFAYSHDRENLFTPKPLDYFDMVSDPLGQASERASLCLFLRGDLLMAPSSVAIVMTRNDWDRPPQKIPHLSPLWHWVAWTSRIGMQVLPDTSVELPFTVSVPLGWNTLASEYKSGKAVLAANPYEVSDDQLLALLRERGVLGAGNPTNPAKRVFQSETGEITIDGPNDLMVLDTPKTVGGFAPAGQEISTKNQGVSIRVESTDATVWLSSLDNQPIRRSRHLLVTHLTDLQNSGIQYAEEARKTLLDWGKLPYLVRSGKARIRFQHESPRKLKVWALSTGGKRLKQIKAVKARETLEFATSVAGDRKRGAWLLYEIAEN
jgi:hypothetical protein